MHVTERCAARVDELGEGAALFVVERAERRAGIADARAREFASITHILDEFAAALQQFEHGKQLRHQLAARDEIAALDACFEQLGMRFGQEVRSARDPASHAPREELERLIVHAATEDEALRQMRREMMQMRDIARAFLHRREVGAFEQLVEDFVADRRAGACREVVEHDRHVERVVDLRAGAASNSSCVGCA